MTKQMLIITGPGNSGKSTTVKMAYSAIIQRAISHQGITDAQYLYFSEREVGVTIRSTSLLGVATQGDSSSHVMNGLNFFQSKKCKIIICATRSRGASLSAAETFAKSHSYSVTYMQKVKISAITQQSNANRMFAKNIAAWACGLLGI